MHKGKFLLAALLALTATAAKAETISVPAGESSAMIDFTNLDESCQSIGKPKGKVTTEPKHGKVSFQWITIALDEDYGTCKGRKGKSLRVFYTPDRGYTGSDFFKVGATMPAYDDGSGSRYVSESFNLSVE